MMRNSYIELIKQTFDFPQEGFDVKDNELAFNDIPLMDIIEEYGTPLRLTYLPKIGEQIKEARGLFKNAMKKLDYKADYFYCYCTKSSHFSFVLEEVLKNDVHIETSSAYDIMIVRKLLEKGLLDKNKFIVCNGYKRPAYKQYIAELIEDGYENTIPVLDNMKELEYYKENCTKKIKLGIRIASEEEPNFEFYTSRLGIRYKDIVKYYRENIQDDERFELKMLHFFINTGIEDSAYYWSELAKCLSVYCELKKICPELNSLNIGGGFPIKKSLAFEYDYEYMVNEIINQINETCKAHQVDVPNIFTEFGSYTVGESGAIIYEVIDQKLQNDRELWYMIDSSFITTLPDTWGMNERFILLSINQWDKEYRRVNLGGLTCDSLDYYNAEAHDNQVFLPKVKEGEHLYIGFFNTGAYQTSLGGYGGVQHCLIPAPKHIIIDRDENGNYTTQLFAEEQSHESMLKILGYS